LPSSGFARRRRVSLLGDLRPALIPIADSIIDTEYIPSGIFSGGAAHLVGWQDFGFSHNALERKSARSHHRQDPNLILCNKDSRPLNRLSSF
jgi:hypothetical protein